MEKSRVSQHESDAILILHDIRSVHNVGALFRTADASGITQIILSGFSPTPIDRFGRPRADLHKAALGAEQSIPWKYVESWSDVVTELKNQGYTIIGIEQSPRAVDYKSVTKKAKMAFVVGTETVGMDQSMMDACDVLIEIPMRGSKESLNVSVAAGIALYRILDQ